MFPLPRLACFCMCCLRKSSLFCYELQHAKIITIVWGSNSFVASTQCQPTFTYKCYNTDYPLQHFSPVILHFCQLSCHVTFHDTQFLCPACKSYHCIKVILLCFILSKTSTCMSPTTKPIVSKLNGRRTHEFTGRAVQC